MRMRGSRRLGGAALVLLASGGMTAACASGETAAAGRPLESLAGADAVDEAAFSTPFHQELSKAVAALDDTNHLRIFSKCLGDGGQFEQVEIFGDGLVIWNAESQIRVPRLAIIAFVNLVHESGFADMPASFGGSPRDDPQLAKPARQAPLKIVCEVEMEIDGAHKRVEQRSRGEQSEELTALAHELLSRCRRRGQMGLRATGLDDGLEKLSVGDLAPATFRLNFTRRPELFQEAAGGFLLQMSGRRVVTRDYRRESGYGPPRKADLSDFEFRRLATRLSILDIEKLPVNLFAPDYIDLSIEILDHRVSVQARQFDGLEPNTHGKLQRDFDSLVAAVDDVRELLEAATQPPDEP